MSYLNQLIFIDTETTGLHGDDTIIQYSYIVSDVKEDMSGLFKPQEVGNLYFYNEKMKPIPESVQLATGMTKEKLQAYEPEFKDNLVKLITSTYGRVVCGWNVNFDIRAIYSTITNLPCVLKDIENPEIKLPAELTGFLPNNHILGIREKYKSDIMEKYYRTCWLLDREEPGVHTSHLGTTMKVKQVEAWNHLEKIGFYAPGFIEKFCKRWFDVENIPDHDARKDVCKLFLITDWVLKQGGRLL